MASPGSFTDPNVASDPDAAANATAQDRAKKNARKRNKHEHTTSMTLPLNIKLCAGMTVALQGWGPEWSDNNWIITEAKHCVGKGKGSETEIYMRKCLIGY